MKLPTLATGTSIPRHGIAPHLFCSGTQARRQAGFTLWELVIVVTIIAITLSMMSLSVTLVDENRELKRVGKDLGKIFHLLNREAVFGTRNYGITVLENGFLVLEYDGASWTPVADSFYNKFKMSESQYSELLLDEELVDLAPKEEPEPHILIMSSGEMTPFEWRISDDFLQSSITLQGDLQGGVLMTGPESMESLEPLG